MENSSQGLIDSTQPNTNTSMDDLDEWKVKLSVNIFIFGIPIVLIFGCVGNIFTFVISFLQAKVKTNIYIYLGTLSVVDTFALFIPGIHFWLYSISDGQINSTLWSNCFPIFGTYFTSHLAAWILAALSMERFLITWFPETFRSNIRASKKRAKWVIVSLAGLSLCLNIVHLFGFHVVTTGHVESCIPKSEFVYFYAYVWTVIDAIMFSFLPSSVIMVCNLLVVYRLFQLKLLSLSRIGPADSDNNHDNENSDNNLNRIIIKTTVMLLVVSFWFVIATTPVVLYVMVAHIGDLNPFDRDPVLTSLVLLSYTNNAATFYMLVITSTTIQAHVRSICLWCNTNVQAGQEELELN